MSTSRMGSGAAWLFGLAAIVVGTGVGYLAVSLGGLGSIGLFALGYVVFAALAVSKTAMGRGGVIGVFMACAVLGCIGYFKTSSSALASYVETTAVTDPQLAGDPQVSAAAASVAGGLGGAFLTVGAFVAATLGSVVGAVIGRKR